MRTKSKWSFNANQEVVFKTINGETKEVISEVSPLEKGYFREREFLILQKRTALNPITLKNVSGYFLQKVLYKIPNRDGYDCHFMQFQKGFSLPCVSVLDARLQTLCGLTFQISPNDPKFTKNIGSAKRIKNENVRQILIDREFEGIPILGLYDENGSEFV